MSEYTAERVERAAGSMRVRSSDEFEVERMLRAYAATLRQQTTNPPEIGSKLVGNGAVSDEVRLFSGDLDVLANLGFPKTAERIRAVLYRDVAPLLRAPAEQPEYSRCPPTYRREEASKALIALGWAWDGKDWVAPTPAEQGGRVDGFEDWRERTESDVSSPHDAAKSSWQAASAQNAQGEPHYWLDEATMYGSKRKEFVRQIPLYLHAERARVPEPTEAMVEAICREHARESVWPDDFDRRAQQLRRDAAVRGYMAALAAAPSQPEDAA